MTQQIINLGTYPNDPSADTMYVAFPKVQSNFTELYTGSNQSGATVIATGSTTARTLAARFAEMKNAADYGAAGDGTTNDSTAVALASAAAVAAGQRFVYFPAGTYYVPTLAGSSVTDVIFVGDGATLTGCAFRKFIVPPNAPTPPAPPVTVTPTSHLKWSRAQASKNGTVTVVFAGDSMAGVDNGGLSPASGVVTWITEKLRADNPSVVFNFLSQSVGGTTLGALNNNFVASSTTLANPFATVNGSKLVTVMWAAHGLSVNRNVVFSGASAVGGLTLNGTYYVYDALTADTFRILAASAAGSTTTGGGASVTSSILQSNVTGNWWQYGTSTWVDGIVATGAQLVFLIFTSNDATGGLSLGNFNNAMAVLNGQPIDVVFCTSPARSYNASSSTYLNAEMTQEDEVAGFIAGYALQNSRGLLDFARQGALMRDGFDPRTSALYSPSTLPGGTVALPYALPTTRDFSLLYYEFGSAGGNAFATTGEVRFQLGLNTTGGANDKTNILRIGRDGGTGNVYYQIDTATGYTTVGPIVTSYPAVFSGENQIFMPVMKVGPFIYVFWQFENQVIFAGNVATFGGDYAPVISCANGAQNAYLGIPCITDYGSARMWMPQLTNTEMWGLPGYNPSPGFGGNYGVHATTLLGQRVYREVLDAQDFELTTGEITGTFTPLIYFGTNLSAATGSFRGWYRIFGGKAEFQIKLLFSSTPVEAGAFNIKVPLNTPINAGSANPLTGGLSGAWPVQVTYTQNLLAVTNGVMSASWLGGGSQVDFKIAGPDFATTAVQAANLQNGSGIVIEGWFIR